MYNEEFLKSKQWTKLLRSIEGAPNIMQFETTRDMDTCRSCASRLNMSDSEEYKYSSVLYREQKIANFFKTPKSAPKKDKMTKEDAVRIEYARGRDLDYFTPEFYASFDTEEGRRRAHILYDKKAGAMELKDNELDLRYLKYRI